MATNKKAAQFLINLGTTPDAQLLKDNLDQYIRLTGMNRKQFYLRGAAAYIGKENPDLVMQIAEYLAGVKQGRPTNKENNGN